MKINYGFCKSATIKEVKENDYALIPGKYVGTPEEEGDGIPFEEKMQKLATELSDQFNLYNIPINYEPNETIDREYCGKNADTLKRFNLLKQKIEQIIKGEV